MLGRLSGVGLLLFNGLLAAQPAPDLVARAERGDVDAQYELGERYLDGGDGVEPDRDRARQWLQRAAERDHTLAAAELGRLLLHQARFGEYFAADAPDMGTQGGREQAFLTLDRYAEQGERWLRKAAERNQRLGQLWLADHLAAQVGSERDAEAVEWYRKAAAQGSLSAQLALALAYAEGRGVARDRAESLRLYRPAAERGDDLAQRWLAFSYRHGWGVGRDLDEAARWQAKADANKESEAPETLPAGTPRSTSLLDEVASYTLLRTHPDAQPQSAELRRVDGHTVTLKMGDPLGTRSGTVYSIDREAIELLELHPNGAGGWVEKILRLQVESPQGGAAGD